MIFEYLEQCGVSDLFLQQLREALKLFDDSGKTQGSRLRHIYQYAKEGALLVAVASLSGDTFSVEATAQTRVCELKSEIEKCTSIPVGNQRLLCGDQVLDDSQPLVAYNISPLSPELSLVRQKPSKIFVLGGYAEAAGAFDGRGIQASGEMFDTSTGVWTPLPAMLTQRARFAAYALDESIVAFGGYGSHGGALSSVEQFKFSSGAWTPLPNLETPRVACAAVVSHRCIYVVGGSFPRAGGTSALVHTFDLSTQAWVPLPSMAEARSRFGIAVLNGRLYVIGGWNFERRELAKSSTEVFDPSTKTWTMLPPMATMRRALAATAMDGKVYALGGADAHGNSLNIAEVFDPSTGVWATLPPMTTRRAAFAAVELDGKIYIAGGNRDGQAIASAESFTPNEGVWAPLPPMTMPRCCHSSGPVPQQI